MEHRHISQSEHVRKRLPSRCHVYLVVQLLGRGNVLQRELRRRRSGNDAKALTEQYNGTSWSIVTSANPGTNQNNILTGVMCTSSSNCWAVGYYCDNTGN